MLAWVKADKSKFYFLAFNRTNNLSKAWTDVVKNPKKNMEVGKMIVYYPENSLLVPITLGCILKV